jgi:hypothetical protein
LRSIPEKTLEHWAGIYLAEARGDDLDGSRHRGGALDWVGMFGKALPRRPSKWAQFWKVVTRCGPDDWWAREAPAMNACWCTSPEAALS